MKHPHSPLRLGALAIAGLLLSVSAAYAHFGMVIPSAPTVMEARGANISVALKFWHPFENVGMNLETPRAFQVFHGGKAQDLLGALKKGTERGMSVFEAAYSIKAPGLYTFVMEPQPYFEESEDCYIIHYTKAYVDAFGDDEGWDEPLGLKTEIVPFVRPGALYAGNVFQGQVLNAGEPVPFAEVEVEWYPGPDKKGIAPFESMVTQTVKADSRGMFVYAAPRAGWWGFAALQEGEEKIPYQGKDKDVEIGAVLWLYFHPFADAGALGK
ncbi:DUF4198 domain-containing protein [Desulfovibrio sp. OttesenSCG-928-A18]|nr:DUF4198 domain-containing protein [Desulfovibrio sp. OttesenSCG-928-A18]